ncbi:hypothetical protein BCR43DRAFT_482304 [Syncephalastrum racemosum]|uniref:GYF domain-containing protein n=1 Tax=Syncephalastrum racemosum TaxID=13706 RepID=A0A1X2HTI1_SYNRA|nr:hypothetical protein BCR43DRAFT_482304 [Syncephalastrum racemosum]
MRQRRITPVFHASNAAHDTQAFLAHLFVLIAMAGSKRRDTIFGDPDEGSSKKRVRFDTKRDSPSTDFEIDHTDALETKKQRRGAVNTEDLSDEEEVGGGIYSESDEDDEEEEQKPKPPADDFDMFAEEAPALPEKKKSRKLGLSDIEGQEMQSRGDESDEDEEGKEGGEPKLTAFNMRQEFEEGSFDQQGNYIRNKEDPQAFHDRWLEGVTKKDMRAAHDAQERRERAEQLREAERQADMPQTQTDIYRELIQYLEPGDNVREALTKLSGGAKIPAWKQKLLDKKNKNKKKPETAATTATLTPEQEAERKHKVERITGLADQMMALGHFNVYDDTYEQMARHIRRPGAES